MARSETRFAVLLFTDIVGSTDLKLRHGVPAYGDALRVHNGHFERLAAASGNIRILQNMGDGYFAEAAGVADALRFSLLFQEAMREGPWGEVRLSTRVGIHAGEIGEVDSEGGCGIVAPAADLAARVMSLALGGQILLTRFPFDEARHFIREHPEVAGKTLPPLRWLAHGPYLMKGRDEPVEVFEVGAEGLAPLVAPPDGEKVKRAIRPGEEETLGWRPAIGLEIPGRPGWHLTELLGAGGFGEVWAGEQTKLRKRRAFKFCFDDERLRALKREVTLVRLLQSALGQRDDIVHLHELKLDEPPFYLESDLAPHGNLLQWAEKQGGLDQVPLERRIALVAHTASALAAAHSLGVLHKDIKPTNILIFDGPDGEPRPRLVDFGIGTLADPSVLGLHGVTSAGFTRATIEHSTGTPTYSPPEYLAGRPYTIQGDIYGLGVLLYQLVTAKPMEPLAPGWERDITNPLLREDIAACVDGDPARRLSSAAELAERLISLDQRREEIEEHERLSRAEAARVEAEAAAAAARHRTTRFRKLAAAFAVLALLALAAGVQAWVSQKRTAMALGEVENKNKEVERKIAENYDQILDAARKAHGTARDRFEVGNPRTGLAHLADALRYNSQLPANKQLSVLPEDAILRVLSLPIVDPSAVGEPMRHEGAVTTADFSPDGKLVVTASEDKTARLWDAATGKPLGEPMRHEDAVRSAEFSPDGRLIATVSRDKTVRLWNAATGKPVGEPMWHGVWLKSEVLSAEFSPDSRLVVTASDDKTARLWDAATGKRVGKWLRHEFEVSSASFSPDGSCVVTASDTTARLWTAITGDSVGVPMEHKRRLTSASFSPDGRWVVTSTGEEIHLWDAATGKPLGKPILDFGVESAGLSPDGRFVVTGFGRTVLLCNTATGKPVGEPMEHEKPVNSASFSPDGRRVVTASDDATARLWDAATGIPVGEPMRHDAGVESAGFSPDGRRVVTASGDATARLWDVATCKPVAEPMRHGEDVKSAGFSPDGRLVFTNSNDDTARLWDPATGKPVGQPLRDEGGIETADFSPDGRRVVTASDEKTVQLWDTTTGRPVGEPMPHQGSVHGAIFSPDGGLVFTNSIDDTARLWDAATGMPVGEPLRHEGGIESADFSPDGRRVLTAIYDNTVQLWDTETGMPLGDPMRHEGAVRSSGYENRMTVERLNAVFSAGFSPDGRLIVTGSRDRTARLWDAATGKPVGEPMRHEGPVLNASFSPDSRRVVTASYNVARLWDAATGIAVGEPMRREMEKGTFTRVYAFFSPDGSRLVYKSDDATARLWDAATGKPHGEPIRHENDVESVGFSPDGRLVVTVSGQTTIRLWDAATGKAVGEPIRHEDRTPTSSALSPDGKLVFTSWGDQTARLWNISLDDFRGTCVNPDDIVSIAGKRINVDGEVVDIPQREVNLWRIEFLAQSVSRDDAWNKLVRWRLADPFTRTITFNGLTTTPEHIEREVTWAMSRLDATKEDLSVFTDAYDRDPGDPLIHLALAAVEGNEASRELFKSHGLKRLAAAEAVSDKAAHQAFGGTYRAKAAIILALQGDQTRARQVFIDLLAKHDPQRQTWGSAAWIEKLNDFEWPRAFRETLGRLQSEALHPPQ